MIEIFRYQREDGREPFTEWLDALRDKAAQARIRVRLRQVQAGNFGDCEPVGLRHRASRSHRRWLPGLLWPAREGDRHPSLWR